MCSFRVSISFTLVFCLTTSATFIHGQVVKTTSHGRVVGFQRSIFNRTIDTFYGIPYAKPPVGPLRFRHSVQPDSWGNATRKVQELPNTCEQFRYTSAFDRKNAGSRIALINTPVSEDCLYLNVWAASTKEKAATGMPVLVWIYGGAFIAGSSTLEVYNGTMLSAKEDVVVVSMQYRLGPFGFLYFGVPDAPGNMALGDQVLALKWIRDNIGAFGGDPNNVTLFGESAGGVCIALHVLSPLSSGLFHRAIVQSNALLPHRREPSNQERSLEASREVRSRGIHNFSVNIVQTAKTRRLN